MVKIYKDNNGEVYILNGNSPKRHRGLLLGFKLRDTYWRYYKYRDLEEIKYIIIDNTKNKSIKSSWGNIIPISILVPKFKSNIPHFIIRSLNGERAVTKKSVYVNISSALKSENFNRKSEPSIYDPKVLYEVQAAEDFIIKNYKEVNTIKLRSSN